MASPPFILKPVYIFPSHRWSFLALAFEFAYTFLILKLCIRILQR
ncbi:hypothetical protein SLEP1_g37876 [Rubroshorea leprosula]|uniref:Uncharacterized protein n=1 Tax=Rubroshorea leprosula TaxID=152421 RepID=A0AAV5KWG1_9ROSI|nr:hypothetical protein SLEP1_g37876 [Rubroshorea leprosula]